LIPRLQKYMEYTRAFHLLAIRQELVAMGEHWGGDWCDERFTVRI